MDKNIRHAFNSIKNELNDHLNSINQSNTETQGIQEYLSDLDTKIDKLNEKLEEIQLMIGKSHFFDIDIDLSHFEQRIMILLYTSEYLLSAYDISQRLELSEKMVNTFIDGLIEKGIPILKQKSLDNRIYHYLDPRFKELQAKKNLLKINVSFSKQLVREEVV